MSSYKLKKFIAGLPMNGWGHCREYPTIIQYLSFFVVSRSIVISGGLEQG
jgi:hypothetical protein